MSESKRKEETSAATKSATTTVIDATRDNTLRIIDEIAKVQPQYAQAITNLHFDYIQTTRNLAQTMFENERQIAQNLNLPQNHQISELVARQSTEATNNFVRAFGTYNQLAINAIDAARENTKIYNRSVDAVTEFASNIAKTWTSYWAAQQQQFTRAL
jgi:hypothetical protein